MLQSDASLLTDMASEVSRSMRREDALFAAGQRLMGVPVDSANAGVPAFPGMCVVQATHPVLTWRSIRLSVAVGGCRWLSRSDVPDCRIMELKAMSGSLVSSKAPQELE